MAFLWTLADIKTKVRDLTGKKLVYQLSEADLLAKINNYYRNILPLHIDADILNGFYTVTVPIAATTIVLPDEVLNVDKPFTFTGENVPFTADEGFFYGRYPLNIAVTPGIARLLLLYGRTLYFQPPADIAYSFRCSAQIKPAVFVNPTDTPLRDEWGMLICFGTAIDIAWDDDELRAKLDPLYFKLRQDAQTPDLMQSTTLRAKGNW